MRKEYEHHSDNDELDLIELAAVLWKHKISGVLVIAGCLIAAGIWCALRPSTPVAEAIITGPEIVQIAPLLDASAKAFPDQQEDVREVQSMYFQYLLGSLTVISENQKNKTQDFSGSKFTFSVEPRSGRKKTDADENIFRVKLSSCQDERTCRDELERILRKNSNDVMQLGIEDLQANLVRNELRARELLLREESTAKATRQQWFAFSRHALNVAERSAFREPQVNSVEGVDWRNLPLLGVDMLKNTYALRNSTPLYLSDNYYRYREDIRRYREIQENLPTVENIRAWRFISPVQSYDASVRPELVMTLFSLLGGIIWGGVILALNFIKKRSTRYSV
ncbi:TPA: Wzz/FepE/Etk N-terminal domain-containing protein [Escherichia coli]